VVCEQCVCLRRGLQKRTGRRCHRDLGNGH
jgi:hypothetical protein